MILETASKLKTQEQEKSIFIKFLYVEIENN